MGPVCFPAEGGTWMRILFDKPAQPVWTPQAPRRGDERSEESIPLSPPRLRRNRASRSAPTTGLFRPREGGCRSLLTAGVLPAALRAHSVRPKSLPAILSTHAAPQAPVRARSAHPSLRDQPTRHPDSAGGPSRTPGSHVFHPKTGPRGLRILCVRLQVARAGVMSSGGPYYVLLLIDRHPLGL